MEADIFLDSEQQWASGFYEILIVIKKNSVIRLAFATKLNLQL